jgi:hypothetical protein
MARNLNHDDIYPLHPLLLAMDNVHELNVDYWLEMAKQLPGLSDGGGPGDEKYAYTKVRQARDSRIKMILAQKGTVKNSPNYYEEFHGYVTDVQRLDWEEKSGKTAILPY